MQVTYDLGTATAINALALWNEDASGIGSLNLLGSTDGVTFVGFASGLTPTDNPINVNYGPQVFVFGSTSARYVRFDASACPQGTSSYQGCAIGEVAFRTTSDVVPEPQSWALLLTGFGLVGTALRRRSMLTA